MTLSSQTCQETSRSNDIFQLKLKKKKKAEIEGSEYSASYRTYIKWTETETRQ